MLLKALPRLGFRAKCYLRRGCPWYPNMARDYLSKHEWGQARMSVERGLDKGALSEPNYARELLQEIRLRLAISQTYEDL